MKLRDPAPILKKGEGESACIYSNLLVDWLTLRIPLDSRLNPALHQRIMDSMGRIFCYDSEGVLLWEKRQLDIEKLRSDTPGLVWQLQGDGKEWYACSTTYCALNIRRVPAGFVASTKRAATGKPGSSWGDAPCGGQPTCEGDPVLCAVALEVWRQRCALHVSDDVLLDDQGVLDGVGNDYEGSPSRPHIFDIGTISVQSGGGGTCPSDITVFGFVVPLSQVCWIFDAMGWAMVVGAWIIAARIIGGAL